MGIAGKDVDEICRFRIERKDKTTMNAVNISLRRRVVRPDRKRRRRFGGESGGDEVRRQAR